MSNTDQGKPAGKSGRRNRKGERGKKAAAQASPTASPAPVELQSPDQDLQLQPEPVHAESPKVDQPAADTPVETVAVAPELQPIAAPSPAEPAPAEPSPAEAAPVQSASIPSEPVKSAAEPAPVSLQTIANAYRDYTRKSLEEFGSFVEQLSTVRSLDKAMTVQSEFVKRAYENSVAESQRICELHSKLAKQTFQPFQGFVGKAPETRGKS
ncbi:phasin family protein [Bradyrhizobium jicamae]|nr:phasin family protein [Bradyrhizobium jicamae]